jgi:ribonuclease BN (tRNA processing enzyme)
VYIKYINYFHQFFFLGDTSKEILEKEWEKLKKYKCIIIECTFIRDEDYEQAEKTKHMHWKDLETYVRDNNNITFVLFHFSQRYKKDEINQFFNTLNYKNVQHWAN